MFRIAAGEGHLNSFLSFSVLNYLLIFGVSAAGACCGPASPAADLLGADRVLGAAPRALHPLSSLRSALSFSLSCARASATCDGA
jgi:hypothetical protein